MDRGAWRAAVHKVARTDSDTTEETEHARTATLGGNHHPDPYCQQV